MSKIAAHNKPLLAIVSGLAVVGERLNSLTIELRGTKGIQSVTRVVDLRDYKGTPWLEFYVDVEFSTGDALSWALEANLDDQKLILQASVGRITVAGETDLRVWPSRPFDDAVDFVNAVEELSLQLVEDCRQRCGSSSS